MHNIQWWKYMYPALPGSKKIHKIILSWKLFWWPIFIFLLFLTNIKTKCLNMVLWMIKIVFETEFFSLLIHKTCLNQTSLEPSFLFEIDRCLVYTGYITGAWFIQIILTTIFYIGTLFKVQFIKDFCFIQDSL